MIQHFVPISAGKDSTAVACLMVERMQKRDFGNRPPRFQFSDTDNENPITIEHLDHIEAQLGITIERLSARSVPGLIDDAAFDRKRDVIRERWPHELRRKRHSVACVDRRAVMRRAEWLAACDCPIVVSPAVPQWRIDIAIEALKPTGNAFLDLCLIHGRFPSKKAKFCTDELKLAPLRMHKEPIWAEGGSTIDWVGERAEESPARAKKPIYQRTRMPAGGSAVIIRPIHKMSAHDVFAIAKRHGLRPNPLYLKGASRVGCWPCINCRKKEIRLVATLTPEKIEWLRMAETLVSLVSRRDQGGAGDCASFFSADKVPGDPDDWGRARIDRVVEWARTGQGGRQFDMMQEIERLQMESDGAYCDSEYGLCE